MMDWAGAGLLSLAAFIVVISFVVVIHELGHFWVGRRFGVHAEAFSVGFGPTLFSWTDNQGTLWKISALPLGGYVQFRGDENAASAPDRETLRRLRDEHGEANTVLHFKPLWQRAAIVAAGPVANFLLAIVLFAILGMTRGEAVLEPRIGLVQDGSPAAEAGFEPGDVVVAIDGEPVDSFYDISETVYMRAGVEMDFVVERDGRTIALTATPERRVMEDGLGGSRARGVLGIGSARDASISVKRESLWSAPLYGVQETLNMIGEILGYIGRLITGQASIEHLSGPVGIATTAGQVANYSVSDTAAGTGAGEPGLGARTANLVLSLLTLSALLSVALGLMNLLPIPVLDGGHLLYYAYEAIAGRPPSAALQQGGFTVGFVLILGSLLIATLNDISYLRDLFS